MDIAGSYSNYLQHIQIAKIIKRYSENQQDIRSIVNGNIDWQNAKHLLDLGCGYGWFEEVLELRLYSITGIDCLEENRQPFLAVAATRATNTFFRRQVLPSPIPFPDEHFDVIVCAYSLYFFPGMLPEIKRLLAPAGTFVIITHSETMLEEGKAFFNFENLKGMIERFSAENGEELLRRYFEKISVIDYPNSLLFHGPDADELASYIDFKREFISGDCDPDVVKDTMLKELRLNGLIRLNKNDRIFFVRK